MIQGLHGGEEGEDAGHGGRGGGGHPGRDMQRAQGESLPNIFFGILLLLLATLDHQGCSDGKKNIQVSVHLHLLRPGMLLTFSLVHLCNTICETQLVQHNL